MLYPFYATNQSLYLCHTRREVGSHPIEVFMYSAKHGYSSLADKAARMTLDLSTTTLFQKAVEFNLNQDLIFKWACFSSIKCHKYA